MPLFRKNSEVELINGSKILSNQNLQRNPVIEEFKHKDSKS